MVNIIFVRSNIKVLHIFNKKWGERVNKNLWDNGEQAIAQKKLLLINLG